MSEDWSGSVDNNRHTLVWDLLCCVRAIDMPDPHAQLQDSRYVKESFNEEAESKIQTGIRTQVDKATQQAGARQADVRTGTRVAGLTRHR